MAIDKYANIATIEATQTANNVLLFQELLTGMGIDPGRNSARAMIIDEIDYYIASASLELMTADTDDIDFGLAVSNAPTTLADIGDRRILHAGFIKRQDLGVAATGVYIRMPMVFQFFPPLITAEMRIYLGVNSNGLGGNVVLRARIYYREVQISQGEFIELVDVFRLVG